MRLKLTFIFYILLIINIFTACENTKKYITDIFSQLENKKQYYDEKPNNQILLKTDSLTLSAGTRRCEIINNSIKWNIESNIMLHEFIMVSFADAIYISDINIKTRSPVENINIICNGEVLGKFNIKKPIHINKKAKNFIFIIEKVSESKILKNNNEKNKKYKIETVTKKIKNKKLKIKFFTDKNKTIRFLYKSKQNQIPDTLRKRPIDAILNKRFVNHKNTANGDSLIQSIYLSDSKNFSFYQYKISDTNPQMYIANGKTNITENGENIKSEVKLFNLLTGKITNYSDTFINKNKAIEGSKLFKNIYTDIQDIVPKKKLLLDSSIRDEEFVNIDLFDTSFVYDIRYATKNNFLGIILYDCPMCLLRCQTAKDLIKVNNELKLYGLKIKIFDCYRPVSVQEKMWKKIPNTDYVANPKTGSNHNRGTAVDLTIVDSEGYELDMGTEFDYFGTKAHTLFKNLPDTVKKNRLFLRNIMKKYNFTGIYSEWWHFNHNTSSQYKPENFMFECK